MTDPLERFRRDYAPLLLRHLSQRDESGLQAAYEQGRRAMQDSIGLLDVVRVHNDLFLEVLSTARDLDEATDLAEAASTLLIDLVASFEVAQRGFMDVRRGAGSPEGSTEAGIPDAEDSPRVSGPRGSQSRLSESN